MTDPMTDEQLIRWLQAEYDRLTAENGRLRTKVAQHESWRKDAEAVAENIYRQRDALVKAAKHLDEQFEPDPEYETGPEECDCERCKARISLRAAVAACGEVGK